KLNTSVNRNLCLHCFVDCWSYYFSNNTMTWQKAREWCQEHYTDMVAIQNQEEITHLNSWLPKKDGYYWIGIRKIQNVWTWVGTNKPLTEEATNWASNEPNNGKNGKIDGKNEDCVEMYVKRYNEPGKWNDERCSKRKTALCYTGEKIHEYIHFTLCVLSIGDTAQKLCIFVKCNKDEVTLPEKVSEVSCSHTNGEYSYDSMCQYSCEEGYQLSSSGSMRCTANGSWSEQPPTCELVQCKELSTPERGFMDCSDPLGSSSYQSTCVFSCEEGYVLAGSQSNSLRCEGSGLWNDSQPHCDGTDSIFVNSPFAFLC
uniref:Selectin E n=1 Tax=Myripristis murdjan TaxID=586833 RepID=A0A667YGA9_9TELE